MVASVDVVEGSRGPDLLLGGELKPPLAEKPLAPASDAD